MKTLLDFDLPVTFFTKSGDKGTVQFVNEHITEKNQRAVGYIDDGEEVSQTSWDINGHYLSTGDTSNLDLVINTEEPDDILLKAVVCKTLDSTVFVNFYLGEGDDYHAAFGGCLSLGDWELLKARVNFDLVEIAS